MLHLVGTINAACEAFGYATQRQAYASLVQHPSFATLSPELQQFVLTTNTTAIGQFYNLDQAISQLFVLPSASITTIKANAEQMQANMTELVALDQARALQGYEDSFSQQRRADIHSEMDAIAAENAALLSDYMETRRTNAATLRTINAEIPTTNPYEETEKISKDLMLRYSAAGNQIITNEDTQTLKYLVNSCPPCSGYATFVVRSVYSTYDKLDDFADDVRCIDEQQALSVGTKQKHYATNEIKLSPNPTHSRTTLEIPKDLILERGEIHLYNILGERVNTYRISPNQTLLEINTEQLPTGTYWCQLVVKDKVFSSKKLIVLN